MEDCDPTTTTQSTADAEYGFAVPRAIVRLMSVASEARVTMATGVRFSSSVARPANCPSELLLLGETGFDGVVCGCVMHDPKLAGEMPLALFDPTIGRADYLGLDTRRSIGVLIGMQLAELSGGDLLQAREVAEEMGFDPDELPAEQPLDVRPRIPPGWRFAVTADGLGVVAQAGDFAPEQEYDQEPDAFDADLDAALVRSDDALARGFVATALWHVRNAIVFSQTASDPAELLARLHAAYRALGRERLIQ